jgi:zinc D-Ala-D-Ala carboxypeptidase
MRRSVFLIAVATLAVPFSTSARAEDKTVVAPASVPPAMVDHIRANARRFASGMDAVLARDGDGLLTLVDKKHSLSPAYVPADLVALTGKRSYTLGRAGLKLRAGAERALEEMSRAAKADGVALVVSSAYRSYEYQKTVYERNVKELGQAAADRESARPGASQHQLGTAADFGSITDDFALTKAGKWLAANAGRFGWSLSFPKDLESVTGYRWECWHYRYVGKEAVALQDEWFGGVQQYMMEFIDAWKKG